MVEYATLDLVVVTSSPTLGTEFIIERREEREHAIDLVPIGSVSWENQTLWGAQGGRNRMGRCHTFQTLLSNQHSARLYRAE